jgi:flagellar motor switch protein FliG
MDSARTLLEKAPGRNAESTTESLQQTDEGLPFDFLKPVDPQNLLAFLHDEHPQTIALILSRLSASYGAQVIAGLPADRQLQVIRRIAHMGQISPEILRQVEQGLKNRMSTVVSQSYEPAGGLPAVAEILNVSERTTERLLLDNLAQEDPELAKEIRRLRFVFEDISKLAEEYVL